MEMYINGYFNEKLSLFVITSNEILEIKSPDSTVMFFGGEEEEGSFD